MSTAGPQSVFLACHSTTPSEAVCRFEIIVRKDADGTLSLGYRLEAEPGRIRIPPVRPSQRMDGLWRHTCFEAFIGGDAPEYCELNFSPSTEWAVYAFDRYREGMTPVELPAARPAPQIVWRRTERGLELDARIHLEDLPRLHADSRLRLGLAAVVEEESDRLSYWALRHPLGKPDFHHPEGFALEL